MACPRLGCSRSGFTRVSKTAESLQSDSATGDAFAVYFEGWISIMHEHGLFLNVVIRLISDRQFVLKGNH